MASKADNWKRLYSFFIDPSEVQIVTVTHDDGHFERFATDRYVMLSLLQAGAHYLWDREAVVDGIYKLRSTQPPVTVESAQRWPTGESVKQRHEAWDGYDRHQLTVTGWATTNGAKPARLLTQENGDGLAPVLVNDELVRHWTENITADRSRLRWTRCGSLSVLRVTRDYQSGPLSTLNGAPEATSEDLLGYVVALKLPAVLPEFPVSIQA